MRRMNVVDAAGTEGQHRARRLELVDQWGVDANVAAEGGKQHQRRQRSVAVLELDQRRPSIGLFARRRRRSVEELGYVLGQR